MQIHRRDEFPDFRNSTADFTMTLFEMTRFSPASFRPSSTPYICMFTGDYPLADAGHGIGKQKASCSRSPWSTATTGSPLPSRWGPLRPGWPRPMARIFDTVTQKNPLRMKFAVALWTRAHRPRRLGAGARFRRVDSRLPEAVWRSPQYDYEDAEFFSVRPGSS